MNVVTWWKDKGLRHPLDILWRVTTLPLVWLAVVVTFLAILIHHRDLEEAKHAALECYYP